MRVCLVTAEYAPQVGGLADYTRLLAGHLSSAGADVLVLTGSGCSGASGEPFEVSASVPAWNYGLFRALRRMADTFRPDVVHLQFQTAAYRMHPAIMLTPSWFRFRRPGVTCITTFHDLREPYLFPKAHAVRRWLLRLMATQSAAVLATNDDDYRRLAGMGAAATVVPIGSNIPRTGEPPFNRTELHERWGVPEAGQVVGFFGLLNRSKGFETLLAALQRLRGGGRAVWLLHMGEPAGASDLTNRVYGQEMEALATRLGLHDALFRTGLLDAPCLSRVLRSVDVCALPFVAGASYRNGTLLAALANGVPLVTTSPVTVAGPAALPALHDGVHALLTPPGDAAALASALGRLLDAPGLRSALARGALELAGAFSWEAIAAQHLAVYRRHAGKAVAPGGP